MRSFRLDADLERCLDEMVYATGRPASDIIREAVRQRWNKHRGEGLKDRLADVIGAVASGGGSSRRTGKAFTALLKKRRTRRS
jgi:hypothetical protein